jgi:hypothetical protein
MRGEKGVLQDSKLQAARDRGTIALIQSPYRDANGG